MCCWLASLAETEECCLACSSRLFLQTHNCYMSFLSRRWTVTWWSRVLLENVIVIWLVKKLPAWNSRVHYSIHEILNQVNPVYTLLLVTYDPFQYPPIYDCQVSKLKFYVHFSSTPFIPHAPLSLASFWST
jgi:hypothetical protein